MKFVYKHRRRKVSGPPERPNGRQRQGGWGGWGVTLYQESVCRMGMLTLKAKHVYGEVKEGSESEAL